MRHCPQSRFWGRIRTQGRRGVGAKPDRIVGGRSPTNEDMRHCPERQLRKRPDQARQGVGRGPAQGSKWAQHTRPVTAHLDLIPAKLERPRAHPPPQGLSCQPLRRQSAQPGAQTAGYGGRTLHQRPMPQGIMPSAHPAPSDPRVLLPLAQQGPHPPAPCGFYLTFNDQSGRRCSSSRSMCARPEDRADYSPLPRFHAHDGRS